MYCHKCGEKTSEEFCGKCGTKIIQSDSIIIKSWRNEEDYNKIIKHPNVLGLISEYSRKSTNKLSGEELINKFDLVFGTVTGLSLGVLTEITVPIYSRLGIKTGKSKYKRFNESIQELFVKAMCSLSKNNHPIEEFHKAKDGIILIGKIKSDLRSFGGNVLIELNKNDDFVNAKVQTVIKGQIFDWGKSKNIVKSIFEDLQNIDLRHDT